MKNKKTTIKYKPNSPLNYQKGGKTNLKNIPPSTLNYQVTDNTIPTDVAPNLDFDNKNLNPYYDINSGGADFFRTILPVPKNVSQLAAKTLLGDARMSNKSLSAKEQLILYNTIKNAQKRTRIKSGGGTEYSDYANQGYGSEEDFNNWFNRGKLSNKDAIVNSLTNDGFKLASTIGRGRYWEDDENIYYTDVYDWNSSEKNYKEADNLYKSIRNNVRDNEEKNLNADKNHKYRMQFKLNKKEMDNKIRKGKSIKYRPDSPLNYQFGGGLSFLDPYLSLGKQWDNFWRGGNYFSPGNVPPTGVYADPKAMLYNTIGNNNATLNAYNANQQVLKDNPYAGEWGDDAHNYYYNKTLNNQYTPSQLDAFSAFEKKGFKANTDNSSYNTWYNGRENYANQAGAQFDSERLKRNNALAEQPGVNKQMGDAFKNTTAGIFSGLNYQNAYKEPEPITLQQGFQGVQYAQYGDQVQPNLTGYTPGSQTELNKSNTIPGGDISMKDVKQDLIGIVKGGGKHGLITKLEKGKEYSFGSDSVTELPINPIKQEEMLHAQFGVNIANPEQLTQYARDQYLQQIAGSAQYGPLQSSAAFNNNMLTGYQNSPQVVGKPIDPYNPSVTNGIYPQQAAYTQPLPGDNTSWNNSTTTKLKKGGTKKVAEYQQMLKNAGYNISVDGAWGPKTQEAYESYTGKKAPSKNSVVTGKAKVASNIAKTNIDTTVGESLLNYQVTDNTNRSNFQYPFVGNLNSAEQITTPSTPTSNPYGFTPAPGYVPLSTNSYRTSPQDEQVMRDGLYTLAGLAGGNMVGGLAIKGITNLPKVGKVIQYGSKYIDKAGNYVSKSGSILGKVPKKIMDVVNKDLYKNFKATPDTWDDLITKGVGTPKFANPANYTPGVRNAWAPVPKQYGGLVYPVPLYQFGGPINNDYTYPIHPITEEFTEIQTEKGEVVSLPDFTIVNVKADKLHKHVDKNDVTDILPAEAYVFSDDDKMKLHLNDKIGGVAIKDMKLGKSVFEYKENEITTGPKDIYFSKLWGKSNELTPAELVNNVKKKFEVRDQKDDFFVERANVENKEQRSEYLDIIKALSEYKKPKSKRIPKAQYGLNVGLPKMYNQPTNNALDGIMGYTNKVMDPYYGMDNNVKSMYNISSSMDSKLFENGGSVPHAQLGMIMRYASPFAIPAELLSRHAKKKQEKQNREDKLRYEAAVNSYVDNVKRTGAIENTGALAGYAASLNVPDLKYNNNSSAISTMSDSFNRRNTMLNAQKYSAINSNGAGSSMARYTTSNNDLGAYLAAIQGNTNQLVSGVNDRQVALEGERAGTIADLTSRGLDNYNSVYNNKATQVYNANVAGMGNISGAAATSNANIGQAQYQSELDKLSYEQYLRDKANAAYDKTSNKFIQGFDTVGNLAMSAATGGFGGMSGGGQQMGSTTLNGQIVPSNWNSQYTSPASQQFNSNYGTNFSLPPMSAPLPGYSNSADLVNRGGMYFNPFTGRWE